MDDKNINDLEEDKELRPSSVNDAVIIEPDETEDAAAPDTENDQDEHGDEKTEEQSSDADSVADTNPDDNDKATASPETTEPAPIVIDEKPAEQTEEAPKLTPKHKEGGMRKKKKIAIACVATVLIVAIVLGIALPIYFSNRGKIFVSSAEDFLNYDGGTYFVLDTDLTVDGDVTVGRGYNLDLNGHTLTVNGTLLFENTGNGEMIVGTRDGDAWVSGGNIDADAIVISCSLEEGSFRLCSTAVAGSVTTDSRANKITFDAPIVSNGPVAISAKEVVINGNMSFGEGDAAAATFTNVDSLTVNAKMISAVDTLPARVYLNAVTARINAAGAVDSLFLTGASKVVSFGTIGTATTYEAPETNPADTTESTEDAEQTEQTNMLVLLDGYNCGSVIDIDTVALEVREGTSVNVTYTDGQGSPVYIRKLDTPLDINVNPGTNKLVAAVAEVNGATGYEFSVDGGEWLLADEQSNEYDITELLRSNTGTHRISARAVGNYSYDDPFDLSAAQNGALYMTGDSVSCEYLYQITLATPTGLSIEGNLLAFGNVSFADYYVVTVNGVDTGRHAASDGETMTVDLTEYLTAGTNSVRVTAHSDNPDILASDEAMTSVVKQVQIAAPSVTAVYDSATTLTTVTIEALEGAATFKVEYTLTDTTGGAKHMVLYTSATTFNISSLAVGDKITVTAQTNGAYLESAPTEVTVTTATVQ